MPNVRVDLLFQIGPGIVYLLLDSPIFGKGAFLQSLTPTEPIVQHMIHHVYLNTWTPSIVAKVFLVSEALMVRDNYDKKKTIIIIIIRELSYVSLSLTHAHAHTHTHTTRVIIIIR